MNSSSKSPLETFIHYSKIQLPPLNTTKSQSKSPSSQSIVFLHPSNGKIITEEQYKFLNRKEEQIPSNKRKYQSLDSTAKAAICKPCHPPTRAEPGKLFSNWSNAKLNEEIAKIQSEIEKINKDTVKEEEIEKYNCLIIKWKKIAQEAVYNLLELFPKDENYNNNTIKSVIKSFKIDPTLLDYDEENDCLND